MDARVRALLLGHPFAGEAGRTPTTCRREGVRAGLWLRVSTAAPRRRISLTYSRSAVTKEARHRDTRCRRSDNAALKTRITHLVAPTNRGKYADREAHAAIAEACRQLSVSGCSASL